LKPGSLPFKKRMALNLFSRFVKTQTKLHELSYLFWECTQRCNINCLHCGSDCKKAPGIPDMPYEDFLKVTRSLSEVYNPSKIIIVITGGEPLLRKDLEQCGRELKKQSYSWGIVTNGYDLTKNRFLNLLSSGLRAITLSIDGLEESHNWLRGNKNSYVNAINSLDLIVQTKNLNYDIVSCINKKILMN
jgi:MoaA/NifB/PqqE/SkfB family radical SAM enzyme